MYRLVLWMKKMAVVLAVWLAVFSPVKTEACALCSIYDPTVFVDLHLNIFQDELQSIEVVWEFSELYTAKAIPTYDTDHSGKLEEEEWKKLQQEFSQALAKQHYHTRFTMDVAPIPLDPGHVANPEFSMGKERLRFSYVIQVGKPLKDEHILQFLFQDDTGFFGFFIRKNYTDIRSDGDWQIAEDSNFYTRVVTLKIRKGKALPSALNTSIQAEKKETGWMVEMALLLQKMMTRLQQQLKSVQNGGGLIAWTMLLGFSMMYGMVHALGPGHGKALVGSYFLATNRGYWQAWGVAGLIAVVHVLSALLLTAVAYWLAGVAADRLAVDAEKWVMAVTGGLMVLLAGYLLLQRWKSRRHHHAHSCGCHSCSGGAVDRLGVVLAAGMIPCPGTVLVFMAVISIGAYGAGFLAAVAMSVGMSLVIGLAGMAGVGLRQGTDQLDSRLLDLFQWGALLMVMVFGIIMASIPMVD